MGQSDVMSSVPKSRSFRAVEPKLRRALTSLRRAASGLDRGTVGTLPSLARLTELHRSLLTEPEEDQPSLLKRLKKVSAFEEVIDEELSCLDPKSSRTQSLYRQLSEVQLEIQREVRRLQREHADDLVVQVGRFRTWLKTQAGEDQADWIETEPDLVKLIVTLPMLASHSEDYATAAHRNLLGLGNQIRQDRDYLGRIDGDDLRRLELSMTFLQTALSTQAGKRNPKPTTHRPIQLEF